jgi:hypothetical protein
MGASSAEKFWSEGTDIERMAKAMCKCKKKGFSEHSNRLSSCADIRDERWQKPQGMS